MANPAARLVMKTLTVAVGIPVGIATKRLVERTWATARPADKPRNANEAGVAWVDAISWAALSAAGVALAQLVTRKGAEEVWRTFIGTEPPPPKSKGSDKAAEVAAVAATTS
jgi:hypothetical protein